MKKLLIILLLCVVLSMCTSINYTVGTKKFSSEESALTYLDQILEESVNKVTIAKYFGGSLMVVEPSDRNLLQPPFVRGTVKPVLRSFFLNYWKKDFKSVANALKKSKMFDSVKLMQIDGYVRYAKDYGFRYLMINNGDGTWTIFDLLLTQDKTIRSLKGLSNLIPMIEDTIEKFESQKSTIQLANQYTPLKEKFHYDDSSKKGCISLQGQGFEARAWILKKIGEVCSSKNIVLKSGQKPDPGYFIVTNEILENGIFTIEFEVVY